MTDKKKLNNVVKAYKTILDFLKAKGFKCDKNEERRSVNFTKTVGFPVEFHFEVQEKELVSLYVKLPFAFSGERRVDGMLAIGEINYRMYDGSFDYKFETGEVFLRLTAAFMDSVVSKELIDSMINNACKALTDYGGKLSALSTGELALDKLFD